MSTHQVPGSIVGQIPTKPSFWDLEGLVWGVVDGRGQSVVSRDRVTESRTGLPWLPLKAGIYFSWLLGTRGASESGLV